MKIMTSYFYAIRYFKPNMIPISTAKWDPKWYHQNKNQSHWFLDKNGVINGLRADIFAPDESTEGQCNGNCELKDPNTCMFLRAYEHQLSQLNLSEIMQRTERLCAAVQPTVGYDEEPIAVFIVHEAPNNPCSERFAIQNYFKKNGIECNEYQW